MEEDQQQRLKRLQKERLKKNKDERKRKIDDVMKKHKDGGTLTATELVMYDKEISRREKERTRMRTYRNRKKGQNTSESQTTNNVPDSTAANYGGTALEAETRAVSSFSAPSPQSTTVPEGTTNRQQTNTITNNDAEATTNIDNTALEAGTATTVSTFSAPLPPSNVSTVSSISVSAVSTTNNSIQSTAALENDAALALTILERDSIEGSGLSRGQTVIVRHGTNLRTEYEATVVSFTGTHVTVRYNVGTTRTEVVEMYRVRILDVNEPRQPRPNTSVINRYSPPPAMPRNVIEPHSSASRVVQRSGSSIATAVVVDNFDNMTYAQRLARYPGNIPQKLKLTEMFKLKTTIVKDLSQYESGLTCSCCLIEIVVDDLIVTLPCTHIYHQQCIFIWMVDNKNNCPNCRFGVDVSNLPNDE